MTTVCSGKDYQRMKNELEHCKEWSEKLFKVLEKRNKDIEELKQRIKELGK